MFLRVRKSWSVCALAIVACSAGYEPNGAGTPESVEQVRERLVLSSNANCTVELTKIDYDQVGNDTSDYIELKVTKTGPGVISTLLDCGVGAIALYDDSSVIVPGVLCTPYSLTLLAGVLIPADGYLEIGQNQGGVSVGAGSVTEGWIRNGRGEIAVLNTALPNGIPTNWLQIEGAAKCNLLGLPVVQVQPENDGSPNLVNVSCDNTFHLVSAVDAVQHTSADCASGGSGGGGGSGGLLGIGGLVNVGGGAGLLNVGGVGGLLNIGGVGGLLNVGGGAGLSTVGGAGGLVNLAGNAGTSNANAGNAGSNAGAGASNVGGGGANGTAGSGVGGDAGSDVGGDAGMAAGGASGGSDMQGDAGQPSSGGKDGAPGGSNSSGAQAGKPDVGKAGEDAGPAMVVEGGGCSCSVPSAGNARSTQALALVVALLGLTLRRRRQPSN
jgi:MYXO-CTERM domain-containing protein